MVENRLYKLIASFVAIFVYLFFAYSLISYMKSDIKPKKDYGFNVEDAIVVNIDSLLKDTPKPVKKTPQEVKPIKKIVQKEIIEKQPPKIVESIEEEKVEKDSRDKSAKSAKDLFSTVRTDQYKKTMREHEKQEEARASRLKKQKAQKAEKRAEAKRKKDLKKKQKRAQQLIQQMNISKPSAHKKSGETHEFWSFVSNKIMAKWQRTIATYDGLTSTVVIRIDNQGRLSYSELLTSGSPLFDTKLKTFLDNLEYERFPSYKYGSFIEAEFEFTDKERGI